MLHKAKMIEWIFMHLQIRKPEVSTMDDTSTVFRVYIAVDGDLLGRIQQGNATTVPY